MRRAKNNARDDLNQPMRRALEIAGVALVATLYPAVRHTLTGRKQTFSHRFATIPPTRLRRSVPQSARTRGWVDPVRRRLTSVRFRRRTLAITDC